jgi:hypothetical protein
VSSSNEIEQLRVEANYCRDRAALLRAKLYGQGLGSNARLQALERELERAQRRLRAARLGGGHEPISP